MGDNISMKFPQVEIGKEKNVWKIEVHFMYNIYFLRVSHVL